MVDRVAEALRVVTVDLARDRVDHGKCALGVNQFTG